MKNCTYSFFDELIYIKNIDPNNKDIREIIKKIFLFTAWVMLQQICETKIVMEMSI